MSDIGSLVVRVAMDNSNFQRGIQNLNRSMKLIQSEFKNATAGLKDHGKGLDGLKTKQEMLSRTIELQAKKVQQYKSKITESENVLKNNEIAHIRLKEKVDNAKKAYEKAAKSIGENAEETKKLKVESEKLDKQYANSEEKLRNNVRVIDNWNVKANNAESKLKSMQKELSKTSKEIAKQENGWNKLSKKLDSVGKKFETVSKKMSSVGKGLTAKLTTPIVGIGVAATKLGMDFEASMSNVSALSGSTGQKLKILENKAREMGAKTSKSAKDAADGMGYMSLAGWKQKQILAGIEPVLRLSEAANIDLARASSLTTDSMSTLGLTVKTLPHYLDVVAQSARNSNTDIDQMAEAYIKSGGMVKSLNIPLEESAIYLDMLANKGVKGSEAGKAFNAVLINLTAPAGKAKKALKALGLSAFDNKGKFKGLTNVMIELQGKLSKLTEAQRNQYLAMIGGKEHIAHLQGMLDGLGTDYSGLKNKVKNCDGALMNMAKTMQNNNKGSITELKSAVEELGIKIYDVLKPSIANIVVKLKEWTNKLNNLTPVQQKTIVKIAGMVAAIGPLLLVGSKLGKGIGKICTLFSTVTGAITVVKTGAEAATLAIAALSKVFALLSWKIVAIGAAIAGVIYIGKKLHKHFSQSSLQVEKFGSDISKSTQKSISEFEKLDKKCSKSLLNLRMNNNKITEDIAKDVTGNFNNMADKIVNANKKKYDKDYNTLKEFMTKNGALREKDQQEILKNIKKKQKFNQDNVRSAQKKINEILKKASNEKRKLTNHEWHVIGTIQRNMNKDAIKAMSQSEREQKSLLERQARNSKKITAQQAADVVKESAKQRDKVIKDAEKTYDKRIQVIQRQRDEEHSISKEKAEMLISAAEHEKEETINAAKGTHEKVVMHAKEQSKEHVNKVDWETGEIKGKWEVIKQEVPEKAKQMYENVKKAFHDKKDEIVNKVKETCDDIQENWKKTKEAAAIKGQEIATNLKKGIEEKKKDVAKAAHEVKEAIKAKFNNIQSEMEQIGSWVVQGLEKGIKFTRKLKDKCENLAKKTVATINNKFDINSPSRVMQQTGKFVVQGLALGIEENTSLAIKQANNLVNRVLNEFTELDNLNIKMKAEVNLEEIKNNNSNILNWGMNNQGTYENYLRYIDKLNEDEVEKSKEYLEEDYNNRISILEKRLKIVKDTNEQEIREEKARIDNQIANLQRINRGLTGKKNRQAKLNYANQIASLQAYKRTYYNVSQGNKTAIIRNLEESKKALQEYYKIANNLLNKRNKSIKEYYKEKENLFNDTMNRFNLGIKRLNIETDNLKDKMENQQAILIIQQQKINTLKNRYIELCKTMGETCKKTIEIKNAFYEATEEIKSMTKAITETKNEMVDNIDSFKNNIINSLQNRYSKELELQESNITRQIENLDKYKEENIKTITKIYDAKIKALDDELKAEGRAEEDKRELRKINELKEAIKFEHNEFNKIELQKELNRVITDRNKRLYRENIENKKKQLQEEKELETNNLNKLYETNKINLQKQRDNVQEFYKNKLTNTNLQAEAEKLILERNFKEIAKLTKEYSSEYENCGKTLGKQIAEGMRTQLNPILNLISAIKYEMEDFRMKEVNSAINDVKYNPLHTGRSFNLNRNNTNNNTTVNNNVTFNSPRTLSPSEQLRKTETTLRNLAFEM